MEAYKILHLVVEGQASDKVRHLLDDEGLHVIIDQMNNKQDYHRAIDAVHYDLILSDMDLQDFDARQALRMIKDSQPGTPFVLLTSKKSDNDEAEMLAQGAVDYLHVDSLPRLANVVTRAIEEAKIKADYAEQLLIQSELINQSKAAFFKTNQLGEIVYSNPYLAMMLNAKKSDVGHKPLTEFVDTKCRECIQKFFANNEPELTMECKLTSPRLEKDIWVRLHIQLHQSGNQEENSYIGSMFDITYLKEAEKKLESLAHYDAVTGLPNRAFLQEMIKTTLFRAKREGYLFALLFIDLDNFKHVNDTFGHTFGDRLLRKVSERIDEVRRDTDYIARIGGDEFVVIVDKILSADVAADVASRLVENLSKTIIVDGIEVNATVSVGISVFPGGGESEEELLKHADVAMYNAKALGKNTYQFYTEHLNEKNMRRLQIDRGLRNAIKNNEFHLVYQPQINLMTGQIEGMEALLRWNSAELGNVTPDEFIPIAESIGVIHAIGNWVVKEAFDDFAKWFVSHPDLRLSLNINCSTAQLQKPPFIEYVQEQINFYDFAGSEIVLEATETMIMKDVERAKVQLGKLSKLGIKFAIDDFGTGYSSLNYLKQLPISILKIDKSFIDDVSMNGNDAAIVKAIIQLANALSLEVIAEGVETKEQADFLKKLGCKSAQGFLFAVPLTADEFTRFLAQKASSQ